MKRIFGILGIAFLGGATALGGYKLFIEKPVVIEKTVEPAMQTVQANYTPAAVVNSVSAPTDFTTAAEKTVNAVVHVKNTAIKEVYNPYEQFFGGDGRSQREQVGTGSGVIISSDGYIVTNNHVIDGASEIEITFNNRKKVKAELIGADRKNDIALLKVEAEDQLPYITFGNSDNAKIGEWVLAVGNPYDLKSTVTAGIISAKGRDLKGNSSVVDSFIQTDAAVNPGNSGGALVNTRGELIGINTAISSRTGSYIGYSFAVPSNITKKIIDDLLEFGNVQEAIIGIGIDNSVNDIEGVKIGTIDKDSDALKAGLQEGDIITKVNDVKIAKFSDLKGQLTAKRPGDYVNVTINRGGEDLIKSVKLSKKSTFTSFNFGVQLKDLTEKERKAKGIEGGAKITATNNKGLVYYEVGEGYVITKINGKEIVNASQAVDMLDQYGKTTNRLYIEMLSPSGQKERYRF